MRQPPAELGQGEETVVTTGEDSAVNVVARVRRRMFVGNDGNLPEQPTEPIARSVRFIETHFERDISLDDLAAAAGHSKFHFARKFKEQTGVTPGQFLRGYRLVQAMGRLVDSAEMIQRVAHASGYQSAAAFSRAFHRVTGSTPYLFRMTRPPRGDQTRLRSA